MSDAMANARALAVRMESEHEDYVDAQLLLAHFRKASPTEVVAMWTSGTNEKGKKLSPFERAALAERWCEVFNELPPIAPGEAPATTDAAEDAPAEVLLNSMLGMHEVMRITGLSKSTVKRKVADGSFPKPIHLSERRIGWPARDVKEWVASKARG